MPDDQLEIMNSILTAPAAAGSDAAAGATPKPSTPAAPAAAPTGATPAAGSQATTQDAGDAGTAGSDEANGAGTTTEDDVFDPFESGDNSPAGQGADDDGETDDEGPDAQTHTVMVDGEEVSVSLGELKRAYSGEGAIQRRLQAATEARNEATQQRAALVQQQRAAEAEVSQDRASLAHALTQLRGMLTAVSVTAPDIALRTSDPTRYLLLKDAYDRAAAAAAQRGTYLDQVLDGYKTSTAEAHAAAQQREAAALAEVMPAFKDPQKAPKAVELILTAARAAGFSDAEVAAAADHRLFVMAAKAGMYDAMVAKKRGAAPSGATVRATKPAHTTVPAAGARQVTNQQRQSAQQARLVKKAQETGKLEDIQATLFVPAPRQRKT